MVLADAVILIAEVDVAEFVIDRDRLDLLRAAPLAEGTREHGADRARAVINQSILMQVSLARRLVIRPAHNRENRSVRLPGVERDAHAVAREFAAEHGQSATVNGRHVRQPVNAQAIRVPLGHDGDVRRLPAHHQTVGDIHIVGTHESAHDFVGVNLAIEPEDIERAVDVLVGAEDEALRGIRPIDPDRRIIGVVLGRLGDHPRFERAGSGARFLGRGRNEGQK